MHQYLLLGKMFVFPSRPIEFHHRTAMIWMETTQHLLFVSHHQSAIPLLSLSLSPSPSPSLSFCRSRQSKRLDSLWLLAVLTKNNVGRQVGRLQIGNEWLKGSSDEVRPPIFLSTSTSVFSDILYWYQRPIPIYSCSPLSNPSCVPYFWHSSCFAIRAMRNRTYGWI